MVKRAGWPPRKNQTGSDIQDFVFAVFVPRLLVRRFRLNSADCSPTTCPCSEPEAEGEKRPLILAGLPNAVTISDLSNSRGADFSQASIRLPWTWGRVPRLGLLPVCQHALRGSPCHVRCRQRRVVHGPGVAWTNRHPCLPGCGRAAERRKSRGQQTRLDLTTRHQLRAAVVYTKSRKKDRPLFFWFVRTEGQGPRSFVALRFSQSQYTIGELASQVAWKRARDAPGGAGGRVGGQKRQGGPARAARERNTRAPKPAGTAKVRGKRTGRNDKPARSGR